MKKIFGFLAAMALVAGFTACSEDGADYQPGEVATGPQVHFPSDATTNFSLTAEDTAVEIPVLRIETEGSIEVPVLATVAEENAALFTLPTYVTFADGEAETTVEVAFDRASMEEGKSYDVTLTLDDPTMTTPYAASSVSLTLTVPEPYVLLGNAIYWDDIIYAGFTGSVSAPYEVEAYEHLNYPGYIFLKNLYTKAYPTSFFIDFGMTEAQIPEYVSYPEEDVYFIIDVRDPQAVVLPVQSIGLNVGYGEMVVGMLSDAGGAAVEDCVGTLKNGVITFPTKMLLWQDDEGAYYGNINGGFKVALPGAVLTDFSVEAEANGYLVDKTGQAYPVLNVAAGADVAAVGVKVVAGDVTADYASVVEEIVANPYLTSVVNGACSVTSAEAMEAGQVTAVVVPFDANGAAQTDDAIAIAFYFAGPGATELPECDINVYVDVFSALFGPGYESMYPDSSTMGFATWGTDIISANIAFVTGLALSDLGFENNIEGEDAEAVLEFIVSQIGDVMQELPADMIADINSEMGLGLYFDELPAAMPHIGFVEAVNSYGVKKLVAMCGYTADAATPAQQVMAGLKLMQYGGVKMLKKAPLR